MTRATWIGAILGLLGSLLLAGCDGGSNLPELSLSGPSSGPASLPSPIAGPAQTGELRLQPGDKLKVTVYGEDKLTGEFDIDPNGYLSLPLAGSIKAAGLNKVELEKQLTKTLRGSYLKNPKVTVDVANFRPIYVLGEVQKPGEYTYRSGLNVMSAIAVAGGATYRASGNRVLIQRSGEAALKEFPLDPSVRIWPGDVIQVPVRYF